MYATSPSFFMSVAFAACLLASACASLDVARSACFEDDTRAWQRIAEPENAALYQHLADDNPALRGGWMYRQEVWFSLRTGEVTLCRLGEANRSGVTYEFAPDGSLADRGFLWITTK